MNNNWKDELMVIYVNKFHKYNSIFVEIESRGLYHYWSKRSLSELLRVVWEWVSEAVRQWGKGWLIGMLRIRDLDLWNEEKYKRTTIFL